jgi:hypothetical protein
VVVAEQLHEHDKEVIEMRNLRRAVVIAVMAMAIGVSSITAFAESVYNTPAEALAGLTGTTVEEVTAARIETGKTYGTLANEAGKLAEFKTELLEMRKDALQAKVAAGSLTQEQAETRLAAMTANQAECDMTGAQKTMLKSGSFLRMMNGSASRAGLGMGQGRQSGNGTCHN